jgi:hypothetical protein
MSSTKITLLSLCMVAFVAACNKGGAADEVVYVEEPAVSVEPTYTGKYK